MLTELRKFFFKNLTMKPIAIHDNKVGFTPRWIEYCIQNSIPFIKVNCYDSGIVEKLKDCSALMWHWNYEIYKDSLFAQQLLVSLSKLNIKVIPEFWTTFLFDDKLGQKYLFEILDIPTPKTFMFYEKDTALRWIKNVNYPIIFKLRTGAGSQNVKLIQSEYSAKRVIKKMFSKGYKFKNKKEILRDRLINFKSYKSYKSFVDLIRIIYRILFPKSNEKFINNEKGYVLFQEFLPNNDFDTRTIIVGNKCFAIRRYNRIDDFRASGSGFIDYDPNLIDKKTIALSFNIAQKLDSRLLALDFLFDKKGNPIVTEFSYGFSVEAYDKCLGYWDDNLIWHEGKKNIQHLMVEDIILQIKNSN